MNEDPDHKRTALRCFWIAAKNSHVEAQYCSGICLEQVTEDILPNKAGDQLPGKAGNTLSEYIDSGGTRVRNAIEMHARCGSVAARDIIRKHEEKCRIRQTDLLNNERPETISLRANAVEENQPGKKRACSPQKEKTKTFVELWRIVTFF